MKTEDDIIFRNKISFTQITRLIFPDSKVHGAHLGPVGPHVGPMNLAIWVIMIFTNEQYSHWFTTRLQICEDLRKCMLAFVYARFQLHK